MNTESVPVVSRVLDVMRTDKAIEFTFSSDTTLVDRVVPQACKHLREYGMTNTDQFKLVLRELLLNAIEHGNHNDLHKSVACRIEKMRGALVEISVEDQGDGFAYQDLDLSMPDDPAQVRQRGFALINAHCDAIQFNDSGNQVTAFIRMASESEFEVRVENEWQVIRANSDLTASIADKFRVLLLGLVNAGHTRFRFDLVEVEDIDSVALSVLFVLAKMLADRGQDAQLEIVHANKSLLMLFRMTRLDRDYTLISE